MGLNMLDSGLSFVMNVDISEVVIEQMKSKYSTESRLLWQTMNCEELKFPDESFNFVVDKGTIDALYCCDQFETAISRTLSEIGRVLKRSSYFIDISFAQPSFRKQIMQFESPDLVFVQFIPIQNPKTEGSLHYIYVFRKG
jgi:RAT1-interacting protein